MRLTSPRERDHETALGYVFALLLGISWASWVAAEAIDVPAAARPGAIRPGEQRPMSPAPPADEVFEVPSIVERPLDIDGGNKIVVTSFELLGASDRPEHKIFAAEVQALVDAKLAGQADGLTVGRIQEVADEVTRYYRLHGLILAQAFVPVQNVLGGAVHIQIMEGLLGRTVAEGQKLYSEKVLQRPFQDLVGKPVTNAGVESALLELNGYPGVSLFGVFQPGQQVGTADMVIKVEEEKRLEASVRADNHGIRETGQNRYRVIGSVNNPTGAGDKFTGTLQHTEQPAFSFFWAAEYERPLPFLYDTVLNFSFNRNQFDVGGAFRDRNIASDTRNMRAALTKHLVRSRQKNLSTRVELARKRAVTKVRAREQSKDNLTTALVGLDFDTVDSKYAGLNAGFLEVTHGFNDFFGAMGDDVGSVAPSRQGGNRSFAEGNFDKVFLSYSRLQAFSILSEKLRHHTFLFRTELQWSPDLLVPLEQYSVGGPTNVRAYQPTEQLYDRAWFASFEWIINAPGIADRPAFGNRTWGEIVQLSFFFDMAAGVLNSALPSEDKSDNFKGAGLAFSVNNPNVFSSKVTMAFPVGKIPGNNRDPQYWLDFNFFY
ncbi:MAG: hemolysin activation/secretion protein [Gammaproteobacteria bacterium]|jgi:hemolysin activation/secretion protein